ncbi:MAG: NAD-dependent epimerase/dehydratase family protein [Patescibacteria group bacterium]
MTNMLHYKRILVLGGSGLVGRNIIETLLEQKVYHLGVVGLKGESNWKNLEKIEKDKKIKINKYSDDLLMPSQFGRYSFKKRETPKNIGNLVRLLKQGIQKNEIRKEPLYKIVLDFRPDYIIDSVNTATHCAYNEISSNIVEGVGIGSLLLLRYYQILYHLLRDDFWREEKKKIRILKYIKIGTTGIGGMGLDIPFTHGEEKPSLPLLKKVAMAGAQTNILLAMRNSHGIANVQEIIPATSIFQLSGFNNDHGEIDGGESQGYALEEFRLLTQQSQMGLIDVKELAKIIVDALQKEYNRHDVLEAFRRSAVTKSTLSVMVRNRALETWTQDQTKHGALSVAHGNLGPWRTRKLLFELFILLNCYHTNKTNFWRLSAQKIQKHIKTDLSKNIPLQKEIKRSGLRVSTSAMRDQVVSDKHIDLSTINITRWRKALQSLGLKNKLISLYAGDILAQLIEQQHDLNAIP